MGSCEAIMTDFLSYLSSRIWSILLPDILVWHAIVVLVNHDVIGTGQFHLLAISEAVWSHGQFAQRRLLFRLEDVTSASPCRSGRLFIEAVHQLIDTGIHTR